MCKLLYSEQRVFTAPSTGPPVPGEKEHAPLRFSGFILETDNFKKTALCFHAFLHSLTQKATHEQHLERLRDESPSRGFVVSWESL